MGLQHHQAGGRIIWWKLRSQRCAGSPLNAYPVAWTSNGERVASCMPGRSA